MLAGNAVSTYFIVMLTFLFAANPMVSVLESWKSMMDGRSCMLFLGRKLRVKFPPLQVVLRLSVDGVIEVILLRGGGASSSLQRIR